MCFRFGADPRASFLGRAVPRKAADRPGKPIGGVDRGRHTAERGKRPRKTVR